jgi:hypothetical protein
MAAATLLLVSTFYLLASIPFAYYHFLQFPHFWWMPAFIALHPVLMAAAAGAIVLSMGPLDPALDRARRRLLVGVVTTAGCMAMVSRTAALQSYELSAVLAFVPLLILIGANLLELIRQRVELERALGSRPQPTETVAVAAFAGVVVAAIYVLDATLVEGAASLLKPAEVVAGAVASFTLHAGLFLAAGVVVGASREVARRRQWSPLAEAIALGAVLVVFAALLLRRAVLIALDMNETFAILVALGAAVALVTLWGAVRVIGSRDGTATGRSVIAIVSIALAVIVVPSIVRLADWGFTLQKILVFAAWGGVTSLAAAAPRRTRRRIAAALVAISASGIAVGVGADAGDRRRADIAAKVDVRLALERYAAFDTSLRVLLDVTRPTMTNREFLEMVRVKGDATDTPALHAPRLQLSDQLQLDRTALPNIFVIVVDSLRPDYLSPYNASVSFTPAIGAFARDSIVMRHAFTPYAGTALSQPALWAGGLIPRRMYPKPFTPLNNLERLLAAGGYQRYISVDEILGVTLGDTEGIVRLDSHVTHPERLEDAFKFDMCRTLGELRERLRRDDATATLFFYSQPQNLHIRVIGGAGHMWRPRVAADGFFEPAVRTLAGLDGCFGEFLADLRARGLYDDSIIVLTSDHGDSYGEEGRWGHAFYVAPEILRIPLIIHVPDRLRRGRVWNDQEVAWLTDVTPTLYELVGARLSDDGQPTGRPLLVRAGAQRARKDPDVYLVQSSYSRIFGLVDRDARWLFTADGNRSNEQFFDLTKPGSPTEPLPEFDRLRFERWLTRELERFNGYYAPDAQRP